MKKFHLRKPNFDFFQIENFINKIDKQFHKYLVLHSNYELIHDYEIGGIHFPEKRKKEIAKSAGFKGTKSASCHSIEDLDSFKNIDYALLSPVFNSISKEGYTAGFDFSRLSKEFSSRKYNFKIIALGGIDEETAVKAFEYGFYGVAVLGALWKEKKAPEEIIRSFNNIKESCRKHIHI